MVNLLTEGTTEQPDRRLEKEERWVGVRLDTIGADMRNRTGEALLHPEDTYKNRIKDNAQKEPSKVQMQEKQKPTKAAVKFLNERSDVVRKELFAQMRGRKE